MQKFANFVLGLIFGALVGAAVALLLAPTSGDTLRTQIQAKVEGTASEVKLAMEEERARLQTELEALKRGEIQLQ
jgi:gas vesicle protein